MNKYFKIKNAMLGQLELELTQDFWAQA